MCACSMEISITAVVEETTGLSMASELVTFSPHLCNCVASRISIDLIVTFADGLALTLATVSGPLAKIHI